MKEFPTRWIVLNDGTTLFKATVVMYINNMLKYDNSMKNDIVNGDAIGYYYGYDNEKKTHICITESMALI